MDAQTGGADRQGSNDRPSVVRGAALVDQLAAATGTIIFCIGAFQFFLPRVASSLTGIDGGVAGHALGLQWAMLGALLLIGGIIRKRSVTIFAAEFILISAFAILIVTMNGEPDQLPSILHGAMAFLGLAIAGLARFANKVAQRHERDLQRGRSHLARRSAGNRDDG